MCLSGEITELGEEQWQLVLQAMQLYRRAASIVKHGTSQRCGETGPSWRYPEGWQAVVRTEQGGQRALVVIHTFGNAPERLDVPLPSDGWAIEDQFPSLAVELLGLALSWVDPGDFRACVLTLRRRCLRMLLDAGGRVTGEPLGDDLVVAAVFTRNPGGNPNVIEMLVRAGANPNPVTSPKGQPEVRLLDSVQGACAQGNCSVPVAETLVKLNHLVPRSSAGEATPVPPAPTPTTPAPEPVGEAEKLPAMFGRDISATGTVSMADGTPFGREEIVATAYSFRGTGGFMVSPERVENGSFPLYLDEHTTRVTVAVVQKGCAVAFIGPFDAAIMNQLDHLHVKLTRGYTATVQVLDGAGHPVAGARLRPYYACPSNAELSLEEVTTDASGSVVIEHIGEAPLNIRVQAEGFQADELTGLHFDSAKPCRWTLHATPPLRGMVTAATGQPITGAVIKLAGVRGPHNETHYDPRKAPVLTNTDAGGRFVLGSLRPDSRYYLFVEAPGYGGAYLREVKLAPGDLNVALDPELLIRGKLIHIPASVVHLGKVHLQYSQSFEFGDNSSGAASQVVDVQPVNGEADFVVGPFYKPSGGRPILENAPLWERKTVGLYVDSWGRAVFSINELPASNFVFDLTQKTNDRAAPKADAAAKPAAPENNATPKKKPSPTAETLDNANGFTAGTLGAFVRLRQDRGGTCYMLSNNHVLADASRARVGDEILQPGALDGGRRPGDVVGRLSAYEKLAFTGANQIDAAIAAVADGITVNAGHLRGIGPVAGVAPAEEIFEEHLPVRKLGRTTGATRGIITAAELGGLHVMYENGLALFNNLIEIQSTAKKPFSQGGDSGSLMVDRGGYTVGLLFAGTETGGQNGTGLTYANPIHKVLDALGIDLVTG